jgi:hypothetical protein
MNIPSDYQSRLVQIGHDNDIAWVKAAQVVAELLDDAKAEGIARMQVYQDAAALLGVRSVTVRGWVGVYRAVGMVLLFEYDGVFCYAHWRALASRARAEKRDICDLAREALATSDDYAGLPIPPDVLAARNGTKPPADPFLAALERVERDVASLKRHVARRPALRDYVTALEKEVARLAKKARSKGET